MARAIDTDGDPVAILQRFPHDLIVSVCDAWILSRRFGTSGERAT